MLIAMAPASWNADAAMYGAKARGRARAELYARAGWRLPERIDRVYDPSLAERVLGFRCRTGFAAVLRALRAGEPLPFAHDPSYVSPREAVEGGVAKSGATALTAGSV